MKFDEYERLHFTRYEAFAKVVGTILDRAIVAAANIPRPQSIQARAKTSDSLRKRLQEAGQVDADVELVRRDLAGVRLIFYTNSDVDRFLNSSIVFDNFTVDRNATKVHHPVEENGDVRYRAVHYTITLNDARASLPEYSDFAGLRCEIQVQTILIHAWAETAHDIIYKTDQREGFGNTALDLIRKRFERIMDKYLVPAGYEFQQAQSDYERLLAGKALLDRNVIESLKSAADNNQRHDQLVALADVVLPLYDDVPSVFSEIVDILAEVAEAARKTPIRQIETPFGNYTGHSSTEIVQKVVEILDSYRYAAIEKVFFLLLTLYTGEPDEHNRKRIIEVIEHLASYNLQVWSQVGPEVQRRLATAIKARGEIPAGGAPFDRGGVASSARRRGHGNNLECEVGLVGIRQHPRRCRGRSKRRRHRSVVRIVQDSNRRCRKARRRQRAQSRDADSDAWRTHRGHPPSNPTGSRPHHRLLCGTDPCNVLRASADDRARGLVRVPSRDRLPRGCAPRTRLQGGGR
ncbi:ppGpp synthetase/RelA/SpoT-type nucleotidyltransferase [Rhizobium mesoamericanum]|uniref:RelA/SpoT domain-containing protein n=1 Tax=Rhizobium mesoamericanum TaxID=1079800 RepID=UPI0027862704|nr:RelA/SpoT domain-containing protein [Rhizobium mesoamericanum]MDQ0561497.1 ppGpp synthetase/RelA/SpoT-type nucleotidyltransferase [Rhizobium mesoamericanum]